MDVDDERYDRARLLRQSVTEAALVGAAATAGTVRSQVWRPVHQSLLLVLRLQRLQLPVLAVHY
jgi:hypothetical protein